MNQIAVHPAPSTRSRAWWLALLCLLALFAWARPARAASSTDTCTSFITSLPASITGVSPGGTYCLTGNLTVTFAPGSSPVQAINVISNSKTTIDCNGFVIQQGTPNPGQTTYGINAPVSGLTVRNCSIKGFSTGIQMVWTNAAGKPVPLFVLLEDNVIDHNDTGISLSNVGSGGPIVRHNRILHSTVAGIAVNGAVDIVDNTVAGVAAASGSGFGVSGISVNAPLGARVEHNQVSGLAGDGSGVVYGIQGSGSSRVVARRNTLVGNGSSGSTGFSCSGGSGRAMDNVFVGFATALDTCGDAGGNDISP
ncbi:MAG TPA: NosD domain-containing protein [Xanthomonadaceae bacterium]|jgi:hypothetical protein